MKTRNGYVSNSSSSSFIIAYDKNIFGDLETFFRNTMLGCETKVESLESISKYFDDEEKDRYTEKAIIGFESLGYSILCISLDNEYECIVRLLQIISKSSGGLFEIIYESGC